MSPAVSISVALATYNGERFLREQLASLAAQTHLPRELVVNDDCSSDETVAILTEFARSAPFPVRVEVNSARLGSTANFDRAIGRCGGSHIALCDQDDVWNGNKIARAVAHFTARPELGMIFTNAERVDEALRPLDVDLWQSLRLPVNLPAIVDSAQGGPFIVARPTVTGATLVFAARLRALVQPFPTDIPYWIHDRWMSALIALAAPVEAIAEPLILYRQHAAQQIGGRERPQTSIGDRVANNRGEMLIHLEAVRRLAKRLAEHRQLHSIVHLEDIAAHLEGRLALAGNRISRLPAIWREWRRGGYDRHSSGIASAAKDLIS